MNLFVQGMRRSGTTILYDALLEDRELRSFYEPLREQKASVGGGSGARDEDAFGETGALREEFRRERYPQLDIAEFNWGGPRKPPLEVKPGLPEHAMDWLRHLLGLAPAVAIKETRFYSKVPELAALDPGAALVHVVRDPRAVAASIVLGRGRRQERMLPDADAFFADRSERKLWSCRPISRRMIKTGLADGADEAALADPSNVLRVLLVWRLTFERAFVEGRRRFGDRYLLIRNEDLRSDPAGSLRSLYSVLGREVPAEVGAWAGANVREPEPVYAGEDPRWGAELRRAGISGELLAQAGYSADLAGTLRE
ncbi:MAG: sulfotransferase [Solirubrobacterales bacterium]